MSIYPYVLSVFVLVALLVTCEAQYGDTRCKCVCPSPAVVNGTKTQKKVYVKDELPSECTCENVVRPIPPKQHEFCLQCECRYEYRNTTTIKVVVIFIVCVVALLFVYMLFLLGLDPFMVQRRSKYHEQMNEEDDQTVTQVPIEPLGAMGPSRRIDRLPRQRSIINRVTDEQKRWKDVVQEQRKSVYDSHSMLN